MKKIYFTVIRTIRKKRSNWSKAQDGVLIQTANTIKHKKWLEASKIIMHKTPFQCHQRFKLLNPNLKKGKWNKEEDKQLIKLVNTFGKCWNLISKIFKTRSNKQIMNRYEEYLNDNMDLKDFSKEEDFIILNNFLLFGKNWNDYKKLLPNRSSRKIKKRFFLLQRVKLLNNFNRNISTSVNEDESFLSNENGRNSVSSRENLVEIKLL